MAELLEVFIQGEKKCYEKGIPYSKIVEEYQKEYALPIALVQVNGRLRELFKPLKENCEISFVTIGEPAGHKTYNRTATILFLKAIYDLYGDEVVSKVKVEFAIGQGFYLSMKSDFLVTKEVVEKVKAKMQELVKEDIRVYKRSYPVGEAKRIFEEHGMLDKVKLLRFRRSSVINVYELDGYHDYFYGYMLPSTGYIHKFDLFQYKDGFMLMLPNVGTSDELEEFVPREHLFETMMLSTKWGNMLGIDTVGDLNEKICKGKIMDIVRVQEALQERRIGEIAKEIHDRGDVRFIMIAGPSSSGKTSFANRLSIQLSTLGLIPHLISLDDYFVDREFTPRDEKGDYNFECLGALDVEKFNQDMLTLLRGETVEMPEFNFKTGKREYKGHYMTMHEGDVFVIEGIHGLNEKMSYALPAESKYKIYISALTTLNIDEHNRIPTTDVRLLRRMVRDMRTRGASAARTIEMWPSVRRGEEENIFPFQEDADAMFNSALIYELSALKQYAEPLLFDIEPGQPQYLEAKRLLKFLEYFLGISTEELPNNSLVREFVGGSCFKV